jgi:hypothetical protein
MVLSDIGSVRAAVGRPPRLAFCIILLIGLRTAWPRRRAASDAWTFGLPADLLGSRSVLDGLTFEDHMFQRFLIQQKEHLRQRTDGTYIDESLALQVLQYHADARL